MISADGDLDEAVAVETGRARFQTCVSTAGISIMSDEPVTAGGLGSGPTPYQLLASALAACTTMTLRLYTERKGWLINEISTTVGHRRDPGTALTDVFERRISLNGSLSPDQRQRLLEIADRCPVHRTLKGGSRIDTKFGGAMREIASAESHMVDMEALIAVGRGSYDFTE